MLNTLDRLEIEEVDRSNCERRYKVNGVPVKLWIICSGTLAARIEGGYDTKRFNQIPEDADTMDSPKLEWIEEPYEFKGWFVKSTLVKTARDNREKLTYNEAFKTEDNNILIVNAEVHQHISITADLIQPIPEDEAIRMNNMIVEDVMLHEDEEIDEEMTEQYKDTLEFFDNSLHPDSFRYLDTYYYYDSIAAGCQHSRIKDVTNKFNRLIELHLQEDEHSYNEAKGIIEELQAKMKRRGSLTGQPYNIDEHIESMAKDIIEEVYNV